MNPGGALADEQRGADLAVGLALGDHRQHLALARGEVAWLGRSGPAIGEEPLARETTKQSMALRRLKTNSETL